jgi:hypothetical protein
VNPSRCTASRIRWTSHQVVGVGAGVRDHQLPFVNRSETALLAALPLTCTSPPPAFGPSDDTDPLFNAWISLASARRLVLFDAPM